MAQVLTRECMAMEEPHRTYPKSRILSPISRGPPELPVAGLSRMLWMLWMIFLGVIHLSTPVECTPVDVRVHHGFAMPTKEIVTSRFNVQSPSVCRTLCLVHPDCRAVTIYKNNTGIDCWFHDQVMRIGQLEENSDAMTLLINYNGSLTCDKPFTDVHGVGCVYMVNMFRHKPEAIDWCKTMDSVIFTADSQQHLERLMSRYLSFVQVDASYLHMNVKYGYWKGDPERLVENVKREPDLAFGECGSLSVKTGKIMGSSCFISRGFVCEKKHPSGPEAAEGVDLNLLSIAK